MLTLSLLPLLIAGLAAATPAALERRAASFYAPEGPGPFALQVIATSGNVAAYSGEFRTFLVITLSYSNRYNPEGVVVANDDDQQWDLITPAQG